MLSRGHYCPKEHQQHLDLAAFQSKVAVAYTQMVTISTDEHHTLQEFRASVGAQWTFLSDPGRTIQQDLDIQEYTDPDHDPMIPHTLVLKPGLVVHSIYNGYWFWGRPSVDDLWRDLRAATREIRPDWDLSTPGLREAWAAGDLCAFTAGTRDRTKGMQHDNGGTTAEDPAERKLFETIRATYALALEPEQHAMIKELRSQPADHSRRRANGIDRRHRDCGRPEHRRRAGVLNGGTTG